MISHAVLDQGAEGPAIRLVCVTPSQATLFFSRGGLYTSTRLFIALDLLLIRRRSQGSKPTRDKATVHGVKTEVKAPAHGLTIFLDKSYRRLLPRELNGDGEVELDSGIIPRT